MCLRCIADFQLKASNGEATFEQWQNNDKRYKGTLWMGEVSNKWHRVKTDILYELAKRRDVRAMEELFDFEPHRAAALKKTMDDMEAEALKAVYGVKEDKPAAKEKAATVVLTGKPNAQQREQLANGLWVTRDVEFKPVVKEDKPAGKKKDVDYAVDELWRAASIFSPLERELQQVAQSYRQVKADRDEAAKLYLDKLKRLTVCLENDLNPPDPDAALPSSTGQSPKSK